jgi:hypothetical protein
MGVNDMVILELSANYDKHTSHSFDKYNLEYFNAEGVPDDYRNRYTTRPSRHYNYSANMTYATTLFPRRLNWNADLSYSYTQDYRSGRNDLFRLDRLNGWGADTDYPLGTLPSAESDMQQALEQRALRKMAPHSRSKFTHALPKRCKEYNHHRI